MGNPIHCMDALRHLATDPTLNPTDRLLAAERVIRSYVAEASPMEQQSRLVALDDEAAGEVVVGEYWADVRRMIAQLINQFPDYD